MKGQFEIEGVTKLSQGAVVFARALSDNDYSACAGHFLGPAIVKGADIPRVIGEDGKPRKNIWAFLLENAADMELYSVGQTVDLSNERVVCNQTFEVTGVNAGTST